MTESDNFKNKFAKLPIPQTKLPSTLSVILQNKDDIEFESNKRAMKKTMYRY